MDNAKLGQHISQQFDDELEDIRNRDMVMGGLVEQQLSDALRSLSDIDAELAEVVMTNDLKSMQWKLPLMKNAFRFWHGVSRRPVIYVW